jgi:hypothetical protein
LLELHPSLRLFSAYLLKLAMLISELPDIHTSVFSGHADVTACRNDVFRGHAEKSSKIMMGCADGARGR